MQAWRFILSGEVVAVAFGCNQQRSDAGLGRSEHAQLNRSAGDPSNILVAPNEDARELLLLHPRDELVVLRFEFGVPVSLFDERGTVDDQVLVDSLAHAGISFQRPEKCDGR